MSVCCSMRRWTGVMDDVATAFSWMLVGARNADTARPEASSSSLRGDDRFRAALMALRVRDAQRSCLFPSTPATECTAARMCRRVYGMNGAGGFPLPVTGSMNCQTCPQTKYSLSSRGRHAVRLGRVIATASAAALTWGCRFRPPHAPLIGLGRATRCATRFRRCRRGYQDFLALSGGILTRYTLTLSTES